MEEQLKQIPSAPGYNISNLKVIRSCHNKGSYLVYFIEGAGRIKIGIAQHPESRIEVMPGFLYNVFVSSHAPYSH